MQAFIILARIFFTLLMLASATGKLLDMPGFYAIVATYHMLPTALIPPAAWALTLFELLLGLVLLTPLWRRAVPWLPPLHVFYLIGLGQALWRGLNIPNCGCFGVFLARPLSWQSIWEDIALLAFALAFYLTSRKSAAPSNPRPMAALGFFGTGLLVATLMAASLMGWPQPSQAAQVDGIELPNTLSNPSLKPLALYGAGSRLYSVFNIKVYTAGLYLDPNTQSSLQGKPIEAQAQQLLQSQERKTIYLVMRQNTAQKDAVKAWAHYLEANCAVPCAVNSEFIQAFLNAQSALKVGDTESYWFGPEGLVLQRNQAVVFSHPSADLSRLVLAAWLGQVPSTQELKQKLLTKILF